MSYGFLKPAARKMEMLPMQAGDVPTTYADINKAKSKLGYAPTTSLKDGLEQFVEWYRADWLDRI